MKKAIISFLLPMMFCCVVYAGDFMSDVHSAVKSYYLVAKAGDHQSKQGYVYSSRCGVHKYRIVFPEKPVVTEEDGIKEVVWENGSVEYYFMCIPCDSEVDSFEPAVTLIHEMFDFIGSTPSLQVNDIQQVLGGPYPTYDLVVTDTESGEKGYARITATPYCIYLTSTAGVSKEEHDVFLRSFWY